jgi:glycosyltransferase involved in cell wall biosynthesis
MRTVLLLTYHFPPSGAVAVYRMLGLVRHLPKFDWQPIVVAPPGVPWEPQDVSLSGQVPPRTPLEQVPFASGMLGKLSRWMAPEAHWLYRAWPACQRMIRAHRPAAVITSSPPGCVHRLGLWAQRAYGFPWLACFRDPWITNASIKNWTWYLRYERRLEAKVMRHATRLIANTPLNQQGWAAAYPEQAHKMVIIPNGFDPERFPSGGERHPMSGFLTMLHAGEIYHGRDPRPLLDVMQQERFPVRVEFLGRNTEAICDVTAEAARRGLSESVVQLGQIPYEDALRRMMNADILLLIHRPGQALGVPAKLYEYLGAGRPILALADPAGDIAWVLRESKVLHRIAAPMNGAAIRQALRELTQAVQAGHDAIPDRQALAQFTRERMAQRFADCLNQCAG